MPSVRPRYTLSLSSHYLKNEMPSLLFWAACSPHQTYPSPCFGTKADTAYDLPLS